MILKMKKRNILTLKKDIMKNSQNTIIYQIILKGKIKYNDLENLYGN